MKVKATYFENHMEDLIYRKTVSATRQDGINAGKAKSQGVELEAEQKLAIGLTLFANYTYTDSEVEENEANPASVGKQLIQLPEHLFNAGTSYEQGLKQRFPHHEIHWGYSSRIVGHKLKKQNINLQTPADVLEQLAAKGYGWAVVQSFNMICGYEFQRLRDSIQDSRLRVSIGHSLLCSSGDLHAVAKATAPFFAKSADEAIVLVGHGTDHCAWSVYPAFEKVLRNHYGKRAFVGVVEGEWPERETIVAEIVAEQFKRVRLVPCMLIALSVPWPNVPGCSEKKSISPWTASSPGPERERRRARRAQMVAVSRLIKGDTVKAHCVHEPNSLSLIAGANLLFPEVGSSPRDGKANTGEGRGRSVNKCSALVVQKDGPVRAISSGRLGKRPTPAGF